MFWPDRALKSGCANVCDCSVAHASAAPARRAYPLNKKASQKREVRREERDRLHDRASPA
ncbi:hypothetical protein DN523_01980 [Burkholderia multivorans]|nr:hypothetical protein DN470_16075 [Burkholderia multivorans]RAA32856.1 hypothetical protein DN471_02625 [Burkholderia multivorans]RAA33209.1 hypothetical protein DN465_18175 [Burkholderia multivorans]RAA40594.1 hypothetical protein DN472_21295 [Burkholderia multivorans]RAA48128.1 hypothetical protein DN500_07980 [Burkholderia multivorans]